MRRASGQMGLVALALGVAALAACGGAEKATAGRTAEIEMVDNAFRPSELTVARGQTVNFRFKNNGTLPHDAFIGDAEAQKEHGETMRSGSGGHAGHGSEGLTVAPGQTGELTYTFDEAGQIEIGCHQPGHYESGMKVTVNVT
ncbi:MAG: cupredoxin domain-containing protein [Actinomycetota bacterium]|nr:cupredoxin domain-containing protein [Actinomycetota bacterium]